MTLPPNPDEREHGRADEHRDPDVDHKQQRIGRDPIAGNNSEHEGPLSGNGDRIRPAFHIMAAAGRRFNPAGAHP